VLNHLRKIVSVGRIIHLVLGIILLILVIGFFVFITRFMSFQSVPESARFVQLFARKV